MQEGESELGGLKIPHGNTTPSSSAPDSQSVDSAAPDLSRPAPLSQPTPPPQPAPVPQPSIPRPTMQPVLNSRPAAPQPPVTSTPPIPRLTSQAFDQPQPTPISPVQLQFQPQPPLQSQFPTQPVSSGTDDIILPSSDPAPHQPKKGLIVVIVLVVLALVVAVVALVVANQNSGGTLFGGNSQQTKQLTKKEVYDMLQNFNAWHYSELISIYNDTVGLVPNLKPDEYTTILPYARYMEYFTQGIDDSIQAYDEIKANIPDYLTDGDLNLQPVKTDINQSLEALLYNIDLMHQFYQAYYEPFTQDTMPTTCFKTQNMLELEQNPSTSVAAESYYLLYCEVVNFLNSNEDPAVFQNTIAAPTATSAALLNSLLLEVPSVTNTIENLCEELAQ